MALLIDGGGAEEANPTASIALASKSLPPSLLPSFPTRHDMGIKQWQISSQFYKESK